MSLSRKHSVPDIADRHRRLIAFALLALGARYAVSASVHLVDSRFESVLEMVADGFALVGVGLVVPVFIWKARNRSKEDWHLYGDPDGFVAQTITRAQSVSWVATFLVLVVLEPLNRLSEWMPTAFFFDMVLAMMILIFSGAYFVLDRAPADESPR
ncbi:MAG: hypothetical protein WEA09_11625 [Gemmatimonadota bacterium]